MNYGEGALDPNIKTPQIPQPPNEPRYWSGEELGNAAEEAVAGFLEGFIPSINEVRISSKEEDSGLNQIVRGQKIDLVVYIDRKPAMVIQVTVSTNDKITKEKKQDVEDRPFVRLPEMRPSDPAIPKVFVQLFGSSVKVFEENNRKFNDHREILMKILKEIREWLDLDLSKTLNPAEKERIQRLMEIFKMEKASPTYLERTS
jgi:hypothetical protein